MVTGIFLIPALNCNTNKNANDAINEIMYQLGALNCEDDDDYAAIRYDGVLNKNAKKILTDIANHHGHHIIYLEAEEDTSFADDDTFHIPTDDEMKEHLKLEEKVNHP
mgnify:CR=1 FL=1